MLAEPIYINQGASLDRLVFAAFIALLLHLLVIGGLTFVAPTFEDDQPFSRHLEITIVQQVGDTSDAESEAEILSEASQQGGGNVDDTESAPSVIEEMQSSLQSGEEAVMSQPEQQQQAQSWKNEFLTTIGESRFQVHPPEQISEVEDELQQEAEDVPEQQQEQATDLAFELDVEDQFEAEKAELEDVIQAETRQAMEAKYVAGVLKILETVGSQEIKGASVVEFLQSHDAIAPTISFVINSNGSIRNIEIIRSSGTQFVDDFFRELIRNVAPFDPLPSELLDTQEQLKITKDFKIDR